MSIASEITRLQNAKNDLKTSIEGKGVTVGDVTLDNYSSKVDLILTRKPEQSKTATPTTSQQTIIPDNGYALSSVTVNAMPSGGLNTPTINSSTGVVTATIGTSGYLASGTNKTLQLSTQGSQTITPATTNQTISSGKYLTGTQTILGDANLVSENIKKNISIFGVTGTLETGINNCIKSIYTVTTAQANNAVKLISENNFIKNNYNNSKAFGLAIKIEDTDPSITRGQILFLNTNIPFGTFSSNTSYGIWWSRNDNSALSAVSRTTNSLATEATPAGHMYATSSGDLFVRTGGVGSALQVGTYYVMFGVME